MLVRYSSSINSDELYRLTQRMNLLNYFSLIHRFQNKLGNVDLKIDEFFLLIGGRKNICDEYLKNGPQNLYTRDLNSTQEPTPKLNRFGINIATPTPDPEANRVIPFVLVSKSAGLKASNDLQICAIGVPSENNREKLEKHFNMMRASFPGSNNSPAGNLMSIVVTMITMLIKPNG